MKEVKLEKCPFCGGEELIETRAISYGGVSLSPLSKSGFHGVVLFATVCRDCGSVVRAYCKEPEKLVPKKDRRA